MSELIRDGIDDAVHFDNVSHVAGFILRQVRKNLNLTIKKATAGRLVSVPAVQKFETGATYVGINSFLKQCFILGVQPHIVIQVALEIMDNDNCKVIMQQREKGKIPLEINKEISKKISVIMQKS